MKGQGKLPRDPWGGLPADANAGSGQQGAAQALSPGAQGQDQKEGLGARGGVGVETGAEPRPKMPTSVL